MKEYYIFVIKVSDYEHNKENSTCKHFLISSEKVPIEVKDILSRLNPHNSIAYALIEPIVETTHNHHGCMHRSASYKKISNQDEIKTLHKFVYDIRDKYKISYDKEPYIVNTTIKIHFLTQEPLNFWYAFDKL